MAAVPLRETFTAAEVKDSAELAPRHSEQVTVACFPEHMTAPLLGHAGVGWNDGIAAARRCTVATCSSSRGQRQAAPAAKRLRVEQPQQPKSAAGVRTMDELLTYLEQ
jgi:hypothetical protein